MLLWIFPRKLKLEFQFGICLNLNFEFCLCFVCFSFVSSITIDTRPHTVLVRSYIRPEINVLLLFLVLHEISLLSFFIFIFF